MMKKWLDQEQKFLDAYEDKSLVDKGIARHWSVGEYNQQVAREANPPSDDPGGGPPETTPALMWTNRKTCEIENYDGGCSWLRSKGLPQAACTIAYDHELVHAAQCKANGPYGKYDLRTFETREIVANTKNIEEIQQWINANCGP
jgi:hypothetical protein